MTASGNGSRTRTQKLIREYHDARRREDQWRIPQLLLALISPVLTLAAILFLFAGSTDNATMAASLAVITGVAAAMSSVRVWEAHKDAVAMMNTFRTEYPDQHALLMKDPL